MHTKDKLAEALRAAGLPEMADRAAQGYYHDYLSPLELPCVELGAHLEKVGTTAAKALLLRHMNGEFDASPEESDEWMRSEDGQKALAFIKKKNEVKGSTH